jgi:hypothetical protein
MMNVRSNEGNKKGFAIRELDIVIVKAAGKGPCSFTITIDHSRDGHTRRNTAWNINTCQCMHNTSYDNTWPPICRCNTRRKGIGEEGEGMGKAMISSNYATPINYGACVRHTRARYSVQSRPTDDALVYLLEPREE